MTRRLLLMPGRLGSECIDNFDDRATATGGPGRAPTGQVWQALAATGTVLGSGGIAAGQFLEAASGTVRWVVDTGFGDGSVQATFATLGAAGTMRLVARVSDVESGWTNEIFVNMNAGTNWTLQKRHEGGTLAVLGTYAAAPVNGDVVKLRAWGPSLTVFVNGTSRITATDPWNGGATKWGISILGSTTARFDAFSVSRL